MTEAWRGAGFMQKEMRMRQMLALSLLVASIGAVPMAAGAHEAVSANTEVTGFVAPRQADRAGAYWTARRIANAKPMPLPELPADRFPGHK
jgi:hypothetical protein